MERHARRVCSGACENTSLEPMGGLAKRFILFCDTAKKHRQTATEMAV